MHRLLLSEAGGALTNGTIESLLAAPEPYYMVGVSSDQYNLQLARTQEKYLVPSANDDNFIPVLNQIIEETNCEVVISQHDSVISVLSAHRDALKAPIYLPSHDVIKVCQDKYRSYRAWEQAGLQVPTTMLVHTPDDLRQAMNDLGPKVWIREIEGGFGKNALPTDSFEFAKFWIDYYEGWGRFTVAELLNPESITWMSIWREGELIVAQTRKRLYWKFGNRNMSGVTGVTGTGLTLSDPVVDEIALAAIKAVDPKPHGIFSVDMTYDRQGTPNPTEINIGRFFTTHRFFTAAGLNMPYILVKLALGEDPPPIAKKINPLTPGLLWVREMDTHPILTSEQTIQDSERLLQQRMDRLK